MAREVLPDVSRVRRFQTGLMHYVFEATDAQDRNVVVRVSRRRDAGVARDSVYWSDLLRPLGVPLPELLYADVAMSRHPFPFVILERLPGRDLNFTVGDLSQTELLSLARRLYEVQVIVAGLGHGLGYGFAPRMEGPFPHTMWRASIASSLARSRKRIREAGIVGEHHADRVEAASDGLSDHFAQVPATPFLHDITTKNVIIDNGHLTGIVDVDDLCFGDPLFLVALIRVALLANGHRSAYADAWLDILRPDAAQTAALNFYTALFCLDFMSELGHSFNQDRPAPVAKALVERLEDLMVRHLAG